MRFLRNKCCSAVPSHLQELVLSLFAGVAVPRGSDSEIVKTTSTHNCQSGFAMQASCRFQKASQREHCAILFSRSGSNVSTLRCSPNRFWSFPFSSRVVWIQDRPWPAWLCLQIPPPCPRACFLSLARETPRKQASLILSAMARSRQSHENFLRRFRVKFAPSLIAAADLIDLCGTAASLKWALLWLWKKSLDLFWPVHSGSESWHERGICLLGRVVCLCVL